MANLPADQTELPECKTIWNLLGDLTEIPECNPRARVPEAECKTARNLPADQTELPKCKMQKGYAVAACVNEANSEPFVKLRVPYREGRDRASSSRSRPHVLAAPASTRWGRR